MLTARVSAFKVLSLKFRKYRFSDISYIIKKEPLKFQRFLVFIAYSHSIVLTGLSEISQRTRLTPGTSAIMRSRMRQSISKGISTD